MSSQNALNTIDLSQKQPLTSKDTIDDSHCLGSRNSGATIHNHAELTQLEKVALHDLLEGWCNTRPNRSVTPILQQMFYARIFESWNTENDSVSIPVAPGKKQQAEVAVAVGTFKNDLPVTPMKRKSGETLQNKPQRRAGARAWLGVQLQPESCSFTTLWRDGLGATVNGDHVRLDDGLTMEKAVGKACVNFDQAEKVRVQGYNTALVIALARTRIIAFAKAGTVHPPVVAEDLRINHRLRQCVLISDNYAKFATMIVNVGTMLERANVGQAGFLM
ncbi:hypothetical protein HYE68_009081 [Fusarium pseudograminearum]|nr:hypothetical protein HYE68_009081 [Fusarium pseudograminearum]